MENKKYVYTIPVDNNNNVNINELMNVLRNPVIIEQSATKETGYTIEQIKKYIMSQDSRGDILYNLSDGNIIKANIPDVIDELDTSDVGLHICVYSKLINQEYPRKCIYCGKPEKPIKS